MSNKCHVIVRNSKGEIIREYDEESGKQLVPDKEIELSHKNSYLCGGGYRKRKVIYDKYEKPYPFDLKESLKK